MSPLHDLQTRITQALLDPELPVPAGIRGPGVASVRRRFAVHRNNFASGLVDVLAGRFPVVHRLVGEEFFRVMALGYVWENPPGSPILLDYGKDFPEFVRRFLPARDLDYLPDVARLEVAASEAHHSEDAACVGPERLSHLSPSELASARATLHPSTRLVQSMHPIVTIWKMNVSDGDPQPIDPWHGEDALVLRNGMSVAVHRLPPGATRFILALARGADFGSAATEAAADDDQFDLGANLAGLFESGALHSLSAGDRS